MPSSDRWLFVLPVEFLEGQKCGVLGGGGPEVGVCNSLSPLSETPITLDSYAPHSIKGRALEEEIQPLQADRFSNIDVNGNE